MKNLINILLIAVFLFTAVFSFTGCAKQTEEKTAIVFVLGNHANSRGLNLKGLQNTVFTTVRNYGFIGVVNADGNPDAIHAKSYDIDDKYKNAADEILNRDARKNTNDILMGMQNVTADDPEVDYLEALRLAARMLASVDGYSSKQIIVIGTGLSTTGVLNFRENIICGDVDDILTILKERSEIPDFTGTTVSWQQLGDTAAPQEPLTSAQRKKLQEIYKSIIEAGGGTFVYNETIANPVNGTAQLPKVSTVDLPDVTPISYNPAEFNMLKDPVFFNEDRVAFVADKAQYLYPDEVRETLGPVAEYLIKNPDVNIVLAGTTAGDTDSEFTLSLSLARAEAVKKSLTELGVDAARITAVGLGSEKDPWHVWNVGYNGPAAKVNRKVVLLDAQDDTAVAILAGRKS